MSFQKLRTLHILLADDDLDDCLLFKEVLEELALSTVLTTANDGEQLMQLLSGNESQLPDILFLDLNMPRKSGFQCLLEIKQRIEWKAIPIIIFSTSLNEDIVNQLYKNGALYYIQKPNEFSDLKKVIYHALSLVLLGILKPPAQAAFVLSSTVYEKEDK